MSSLILKEEYRLRALRRIFELKRDGLAGEWRKLHNGNFITCTHSQVTVRIIKLMRMK
jgi:hypothetical protein